jgi:hypothetical protein
MISPDLILPQMALIVATKRRLGKSSPEIFVQSSAFSRYANAVQNGMVGVQGEFKEFHYA